MTNDDSDLRAQFEALRAEDVRSVRPFAASWEAARLRVKRRRGWKPVAAAAAAVALLSAAAIALYVRPAAHPPIPDISRWQSPTASLLKTPGSELFTEMPRFGGSVVPPVKDENK
jgi:hypothetical protein